MPAGNGTILNVEKMRNSSKGRQVKELEAKLERLKQEMEEPGKTEGAKKAKDEADWKAKGDLDREAKEEADHKAKAEADIKAQEESDQKAKEGANTDTNNLDDPNDIIINIGKHKLQCSTGIHKLPSND